MFFLLSATSKIYLNLKRKRSLGKLTCKYDGPPGTISRRKHTEDAADIKERAIFVNRTSPVATVSQLGDDHK